jgi:hypothetical protein
MSVVNDNQFVMDFSPKSVLLKNVAIGSLIENFVVLLIINEP